MRYEISGSDIMQKEVAKHGKGAHVMIPKDWLGNHVLIVRSGEIKGVKNMAAGNYAEAKKLLEQLVNGDEGDATNIKTGIEKALSCLEGGSERKEAEKGKKVSE